MSEFLRVPLHVYEDPLARIWTTCAENVGFSVARAADFYASTDGSGTIYIGTDEILDPDDCLAQMIFHELCHALVEGDEGERQPDWGLDNTSGRHTWREHACLRLQAYLASAWGLRDFFAPTTDFRVKFWNSLMDDPFQSASNEGRRERSCVAARIGAWRASLPRWQPHLSVALEASATVVASVRRASGTRTLKNRQLPLTSLYDVSGPRPTPHPAGHSFVAPWYHQESCGTCAWSFNHRKRMRCRHAAHAKLSVDSPACARWEAKSALTCTSCGACCREAYDSVEVAETDPFVKRHPHLVEFGGKRLKVKRIAGRCAALIGGNNGADNYGCAVYEERPRTCCEFTPGSEHCLTARRKVGLSL